MKLVLLEVLLACVLAMSAWAQTPSSSLPRFEDYPANEVFKGPSAPVKLSSNSERMFKTQLTNAAKEHPNFAGHYRFAIWGCGSNCAAGAIVDLKTGEVFQPPLATANAGGWDRWIISAGMMEGAAIDFNADSRLVIVRGGMNYSERLQKNVPNVYCFVWEGNRFRRILH